VRVTLFTIFINRRTQVLRQEYFKR